MYIAQINEAIQGFVFEVKAESWLTVIYHAKISTNFLFVFGYMTFLVKYICLSDRSNCAVLSRVETSTIGVTNACHKIYGRNMDGS
ncbi:hypothetical protein AcV7_000076 [Taiwanofungus camphoratus]|nr:hypothetical protein AcV7_000076 [Antrodia cinnamomea]